MLTAAEMMLGMMMQTAANCARRSIEMSLTSDTNGMANLEQLYLTPDALQISPSKDESDSGDYQLSSPRVNLLSVCDSLLMSLTSIRFISTKAAVNNVHGCL